MLLDAIFSLHYPGFLGGEFCIIQSIEMQSVCENIMVTVYDDELIVV